MTWPDEYLSSSLNVGLCLILNKFLLMCIIHFAWYPGKCYRATNQDPLVFTYFECDVPSFKSVLRAFMSDCRRILILYKDFRKLMFRFIQIFLFRYFKFKSIFTTGIATLVFVKCWHIHSVYKDNPKRMCLLIRVNTVCKLLFKVVCSWKSTCYLFKVVSKYGCYRIVNGFITLP